MDKKSIIAITTKLSMFVTEFCIEPYCIDIWNDSIKLQTSHSTAQLKVLKDGRLDIETTEIDNYGYITLCFKYDDFNFKVVLT